MFHFGSISLIDDPIRRTTLFAVEDAKKAGAVISYDPNLRLPLWRDAESAREGMMLGWGHANVIKVSDDEFDFLGGDVEKLWHDDLQLLIITRGKEGCTFVRPQTTSEFFRTRSGIQSRSVDTTGAGDGFVAGLLSGLLTHLTPLTMKKRCARSVGMPTRSEPSPPQNAARSPRFPHRKKWIIFSSHTDLMTDVMSKSAQKNVRWEFKIAWRRVHVST